METQILLSGGFAYIEPDKSGILEEGGGEVESKLKTLDPLIIKFLKTPP